MTYTSQNLSDQAQYLIAQCGLLTPTQLNEYLRRQWEYPHVTTRCGKLEPMSQWISSLSKTDYPHAYDIAFFGGGQDYEQTIVSEDLPDKKEDLARLLMTMVWSFGLSVVAFSAFWVSNYIEASGNALKGARWYYGPLIRSTKSTTAISVISRSITKNLTKPRAGETAQGRTFLWRMKPLGKSYTETGTIKKVAAKAFITKTSWELLWSYLVLKCHLAYRLVSTALKIKRQGTFLLPAIIVIYLGQSDVLM